MTTTNEPGIYKENEYGIRTENTMLCVDDQETDSGKFYEFEVISFCPIDQRAIIPEMLSQKQKDWLNNYHQDVFEKLSLSLDEAERNWLKQQTRKI